MTERAADFSLNDLVRDTLEQIERTESEGFHPSRVLLRYVRLNSQSLERVVGGETVLENVTEHFRICNPCRKVADSVRLY